MRFRILFGAVCGVVVYVLVVVYTFAESPEAPYTSVFEAVYAVLGWPASVTQSLLGRFDPAIAHRLLRVLLAGVVVYAVLGAAAGIVLPWVVGAVLDRFRRV